MTRLIVRCSQRGCAWEAEGDATPVECKVCLNPLLDSDVTVANDFADTEPSTEHVDPDAPAE